MKTLCEQFDDILAADDPDPEALAQFRELLQAADERPNGAMRKQLRRIAMARRDELIRKMAWSLQPAYFSSYERTENVTWKIERYMASGWHRGDSHATEVPPRLDYWDALAWEILHTGLDVPGTSQMRKIIMSPGSRAAPEGAMQAPGTSLGGF